MKASALATATVGVIAGLACALISYLYPPAPLLHDEFSYLLAADTFASGRLANPTPPAWVHFETMHVLLQPTYASKYPAGQGLVLAAGEYLAGRPIVGVWLSMAAAAMAIHWMLRGWMTGPWPLIGALTIALHPRLVQGWGNTYWGGAVALAGGALLYGALPRLLEQPKRSSAAALGIGLACLALTRPFEGLVASLPVALALSVHIVRGGPAAGRTLRAAWLPLSLTLIPLAGFLAVHNKAVTGDALRMPYAEYHRQYEVVPLFLFQSFSEAPSYSHAVQREFFEAAAGRGYRARRSLAGFLDGCRRNMVLYGGFLIGWSFAAVGLGLLLALAERRVRFALACSCLFILTLNLETFGVPHYAAPFLACVVFLWTRGLQALWEWRGGIPALRIAAALLVAIGMALHSAEAKRHAEHRASFDLYRRPKIIEWLEAKPGDHLVLVRYGERHNPHLEWVQNEADLEEARVVWAREMDRARTAALLREFPERSPWLLHADRRPQVPIPYELDEKR